MYLACSPWLICAEWLMALSSGVRDQSSDSGPCITHMSDFFFFPKTNTEFCDDLSFFWISQAYDTIRYNLQRELCLMVSLVAINSKVHRSMSHACWQPCMFQNSCADTTPDALNIAASVNARTSAWVNFDFVPANNTEFLTCLFLSQQIGGCGLRQHAWENTWHALQDIG